MSYNPLLDAIEQGESKTLELKAHLPQGEQLAKTLIAFANTSGGKLVVGVTDERELIGLGDADIFAVQDSIASIIHSCCMPSLLPEIYIENVNGTELLVVEVSRGSLLPYYLKTKGREQGTYIRLGATNRPASLDYIQELERLRQNQCFDEQIDPSVDFASIDIRPLVTRFEHVGKPLDHDKMRNLKLIQQQKGKTFATHGLLILLGYYDHVEIKCSRFKGNNMAVFLDKKEYSTDVFSQLEQTELFIKNHLRLKAEINGLQRTETYELPIPAIREALVNAVLHRDYSNPGRDIKVGVYDDILNIVSPGGLPSGLTLADLRLGRSEIRNRVLARVFKALGYIEQWGSGIQRIEHYIAQAGLPAPQLSEKDDFVDWEFPRLPLDGSVEESSQRDMAEKSSEKILALLQAKPTLSAKALSTELGISARAVEKQLANLKTAGKIRRVGPAKGGHWEVNDDK